MVRTTPLLSLIVIIMPENLMIEFAVASRPIKVSVIASAIMNGCAES